MHDLAVIIVSYNSAEWLRPNLTTLFEHAGDITLDVVVTDCDSDDDTVALVEAEFPRARVVRCANRGFAHGNNRALMTTDARYVLFLNPDTEVATGSLADLVEAMDARPGVGLVGVRQVSAEGRLHPTIRRFPSPARAFGDALGSEGWRLRGRWMGERELDLSLYDQEVVCDWTSGSFMLARREALESAGYMDERFFLYGEEPDLCIRIKQAGWEVRHLPTMTIIHHAGKGGIDPRMEAQDAFARRQYARKHFQPVRRAAYLAAVGCGLALRAGLAGGARAAAARRALRVLVGAEGPPFGAPPRIALAARFGGPPSGGPPK